MTLYELHKVGIGLSARYAKWAVAAELSKEYNSNNMLQWLIELSRRNSQATVFFRESIRADKPDRHFIVKFTVTEDRIGFLWKKVEQVAL